MLPPTAKFPLFTPSPFLSTLRKGGKIITLKMAFKIHQMSNNYVKLKYIYFLILSVIIIFHIINVTDSSIIAKSAQPYAITTLVSTSEYTVGANVLLFSVRKFIIPSVLQRVTFIALLIEGKPDNLIIETELSKGWLRRYVSLITPAQPEKVPSHFKEQFTKLHLWKLIEFKRVLYLDCDTLAGL